MTRILIYEVVTKYHYDRAGLVADLLLYFHVGWAWQLQPDTTNKHQTKYKHDLPNCLTVSRHQHNTQTFPTSQVMDQLYTVQWIRNL